LIYSYPNHGNAISTILTRRFDALPSLLEDFGTVILPALIDQLRAGKEWTIGSIGIAVRALSTLLRARDDILALGVMELNTILQCLQETYTRLNGKGKGQGDEGLKVKEEVLLLVHRLVNAVGDEEVVKRSMGPKESVDVGRAFIDGTLRQDYETIFDGGVISDEVMLKLKRFQDERASVGVSRSWLRLTSCLGRSREKARHLEILMPRRSRT
jgi:hypothetical protein